MFQCSDSTPPSCMAEPAIPQHPVRALAQISAGQPGARGHFVAQLKIFNCTVKVFGKNVLNICHHFSVSVILPNIGTLFSQNFSFLHNCKLFSSILHTGVEYRSLAQSIEHKWVYEIHPSQVLKQTEIQQASTSKCKNIMEYF